MVFDTTRSKPYNYKLRKDEDMSLAGFVETVCCIELPLENLRESNKKVKLAFYSNVWKTKYDKDGNYLGIEDKKEPIRFSKFRIGPEFELDPKYLIDDLATLFLEVSFEETPEEKIERLKREIKETEERAKESKNENKEKSKILYCSQ